MVVRRLEGDFRADASGIPDRNPDAREAFHPPIISWGGRERQT